jgi:hypothetical protein
VTFFSHCEPAVTNSVCLLTNAFVHFFDGWALELIVVMAAAMNEDGAEWWGEFTISAASITEACGSIPVVAAEFQDDGNKLLRLEVTDNAEDETFAAFVAVLQQTTVQSVLSAISFDAFAFSHEERFPPTHLNPFFRVLLPTLPVMRTMELLSCTLPPTVLGQLAGAEGLAASSLRELVLQECTIDAPGINYLVSFVRWGPPLQRLVVIPERPGNVGLEPEECRNLCNAVFESRHLRDLKIKVNRIEADTLGRIAETSTFDSAGNLNELQSSPLRSLSINAHFSREGFETLARKLRTNTRLRALVLVDRKIELRQYLPLLEETLRTYNYTLRVVEVELDTRITEPFEAILYRNQRIYAAHKYLWPHNCNVPLPSIWLHAADIMRPMPTLLFRLVRGNVPIMTKIVTELHTKKRAAVKELRPETFYEQTTN